LKIRLINIDYSQKLQGFDKKAIDNALDFLQRRHQNHFLNTPPSNFSGAILVICVISILLSTKILFIDCPYSVTERVNGVFASSSSIDGNNPYIARNSSGMIILGKSTYIFPSIEEEEANTPLTLSVS